MTFYIGETVINIVSLIHESLHCILCCNILNNPHQAPCGCRFCFNCISDYLQDENKICPGQSEDCFQVKLNIVKDFKLDALAKREINKLIGKCPFYDCDKEYEIHEMKKHIEMCALSTAPCKRCNTYIVRKEYSNHEAFECMEIVVRCEFCHVTMKRKYINEEHHNYEHHNLCSEYSNTCPNKCGEENNVIWLEHRRICSKKVVSCPYQSIGCASNNGTLTSMSKHMIDNGFDHAEVLLKYIDNINNELMVLKNELVTIVNERNDQHLKDIQDQNKRIDDVTVAVEEVKQFNLNILPQFCNIVKLEISSHFDSSAVSESFVIKQLNEKTEMLNKKMETMKNDVEKGLLKDIHSLRIENNLLKKELSDLKNMFCPLEKSLNVEIKECRLNWNINNFFNASYFYSPIFYTHNEGYKLDLEIRKELKGFLSIFARLKSGEYDDYLTWPFRKKIIIRIIDQENLDRNYERCIKFDFKTGTISQRKYFTEIGAYGFQKFISYEECRKQTYLLPKKTLLIQCFIQELNER